jgi:hypothetical protein
MFQSQFTTSIILNFNRYYTGDDSYNNVTTQALLFQTGPDGNYEPANQTRVEVKILSLPSLLNKLTQFSG